jgi:hypothetical protein
MNLLGSMAVGLSYKPPEGKPETFAVGLLAPYIFLVVGEKLFLLEGPPFYAIPGVLPELFIPVPRPIPG